MTSNKTTGGKSDWELHNPSQISKNPQGVPVSDLLSCTRPSLGFAKQSTVSFRRSCKREDPAGKALSPTARDGPAVPCRLAFPSAALERSWNWNRNESSGTCAGILSFYLKTRNTLPLQYNTPCSEPAQSGGCDSASHVLLSGCSSFWLAHVRTQTEKTPVVCTCIAAAGSCGWRHLFVGTQRQEEGAGRDCPAPPAAL